MRAHRYRGTLWPSSMDVHNKDSQKQSCADAKKGRAMLCRTASPAPATAIPGVPQGRTGCVTAGCAVVAPRDIYIVATPQRGDKEVSLGSCHHDTSTILRPLGGAMSRGAGRVRDPRLDLDAVPRKEASMETRPAGKIVSERRVVAGRGDMLLLQMVPGQARSSCRPDDLASVIRDDHL